MSTLIGKTKEQILEIMKDYDLADICTEEELKYALNLVKDEIRPTVNEWTLEKDIEIDTEDCA